MTFGGRGDVIGCELAENERLTTKAKFARSTGLFPLIRGTVTN